MFENREVLIDNLSIQKGFLISIYISDGLSLYDVQKTLHDRYRVCMSIQDKKERMLAVYTIKNARDVLQKYYTVPPKGLILFFGNLISIYFEPDIKVENTSCIFDNKFHVEILEKF